uniref:Uncharacterized protein n=1 Tax=Gopherus evgoodei TaxID=1825980 RepID=A0A8C4WN44_9SAUR
MTFFRILSTILVLLSLLLLMIALGFDFWVTDNSSIQIGLWKTCIRSVCFQYSPVPGKGRRLCQGSHLYHQPAPQGRTRVLSPVLGGEGVCAVLFPPGLCAMIALAVFTGEVAKTSNVPLGQVPFGWSFGLGWASFPLFLITGEACLYGDPSTGAEMRPPLVQGPGFVYMGTPRLVLRCCHLWDGAQGMFIWGPLDWC